MSDQEIKVLLTFDAKQALDDQERLRVTINRLKTDLKSLVDQSAASGKAFGTLGERIRVSWEVQKKLIQDALNAQRQLLDSQQKSISGQKKSTAPGIDTTNLDKLQEELKASYDELNKLEEEFRQASKFVVDETLKMYNAEGQFRQSITATNADVVKAGTFYAQYSQALVLARADLQALINTQGIAKGNTTALTQAQQALIKAYTEQQLAPFRGANGKIMAGAYETQEFAQAKKNVADYAANVKAAGTQIKSEWQDVARAVAQADRKAKKQKKA